MEITVVVGWNLKKRPYYWLIGAPCSFMILNFVRLQKSSDVLPNRSMDKCRVCLHLPYMPEDVNILLEGRWPIELKFKKTTILLIDWCTLQLHISLYYRWIAKDSDEAKLFRQIFKSLPCKISTMWIVGLPCPSIPTWSHFQVVCKTALNWTRPALILLFKVAHVFW